LEFVELSAKSTFFEEALYKIFELVSLAVLHEGFEKGVHLLFLGPAFSFELLQSFGVEESVVDNEAFSADPFIESTIVKRKDPELGLDVLLAIEVAEIHLRQQHLCVIIVLRHKVPSERHVPHQIRCPSRLQGL
jgi:hypothetical protein